MNLSFKKALIGALFLILSSGLSAAAEAQDPLMPDVSKTASLDFANGLYARKMYAPAVSEYEKFIQTNPASPEIASARFRLADCFYFLKDYAKAISLFEAFLKDFPADQRAGIARFRIGTSKFSTQDLEGAKLVFMKLIKDKVDPNIRSGSFFFIAKIEEAQGRPNKSPMILKRLIKVYPDTEYAAYAGLALGDIYVREENYNEAATAYQAAAEKKEPATLAEQATLKLAEVYFLKKEYKRAHEYYHKIYDRVKAPMSDANGAKPEPSPIFEKSLEGLFYCDYHIKNLKEAQALFRKNQDFLQKAESRQEILYFLSSLAYEQKSYNFALECLDRIVGDAATSDEMMEKALFKRSDLLRTLNKKEEASAQLAKIAAGKFKNTARAYFERAEILKEQEKYEEAVKVYEAALASPESQYSKPALYEAGVLDFKLGYKTKAKKHFVSYFEKYPKEKEAHQLYLQAVQIDLDLENFEEASRNVSRFIEAHPKSEVLDIAYYKLGIAQTGLKKFKEAVSSFQKISTDFKTSIVYPETLYGAAASSESIPDISQAVRFYEQLISNYPDHYLAKDSLMRLGHLYIQTENYEKAAALYEDILLNKPAVSVSSGAALWLIRHDLKNGDYDHMQKILAILPQRFLNENLTHETDFFLAESYMGAKDYDKAVEYYTKAVQDNPQGRYIAHAYLGLGVAYVVKENLSQAEKNFQKALRFDSEMDVAIRAHFELANVRLRAGETEEAAKAFMLVAILYDDEKYCPVALYKAGECFSKKNKIDEAQKAFKELKTRYPQSEWARKLR